MFSRSLRLSHRVLLVPALLMLSLTSIVAYTHTTLQGQTSASVVLNMAGRQRMLNQRFAKELLQERAGGPSRSGKTLQLLEASVLALRDGGDVPLPGGKVATVPAAKDPEVREAFDDQIERVAAYQAMLGATGHEEDFDMSAFDEQVGEFHKVANGAVGLLQKKSSRSLALLASRGLWLGISATLLGLLLTWRLIGQILTPINRARAALEIMASGRLVERVDETAGSDLSALARSLNSFQDQLTEDLGGVATTAHRIDSGAGKSVSYTHLTLPTKA